MKNLLKCAIFLSVLCLSFGEARALNTLAFSYDEGLGAQRWWGTQKKESYDIAVKMDIPAFVGSEIVGIRVAVPDNEAVSGFSGWLSTELNLENKQNVADITSKDGTQAEGILEIYFDTPYLLTDEGVYVGYSFTVNDVSDFDGKYPMSAAAGTNPNGLFMHTSRSYLKWAAKSEELNMLSSLQVLIRGELSENSVKAISISEINTKVGESAVEKVMLTNTGVNAVHSIGYTLTVGNEVVNGVKEFDPVIPAQYGLIQTIEIEAPKMDQKGEYAVVFTIETVNGEPNNEVEKSSLTNYYALSFYPKHNPYLEEFTGTWCSWCPSGWMAMEMMNERHPDFIGVAYHCGDVMALKSNRIPDPEVGYPMAAMDREITCSPYFGLEERGDAFGIEALWEDYCQKFTPFEISIEADFTDATRSAVKVDAKVVSVKDLNGAEYRIEYVLLADSLTGTGGAWVQQNSYAGDESYRGMEGMDFFIDNKYVVVGLHFNDVAVMNTGILGVEGSLPSNIEAEKEYLHSYEFTLADAVNSAESPIIQNTDNLRAVALVVHNDGSTFGKVMNAAKCTLASVSGIDDAFAESTSVVTQTKYYDLNGRLVSNPQKGIVIKIDYMSDGRRVVTKLVR